MNALKKSSSVIFLLLFLPSSFLACNSETNFAEKRERMLKEQLIWRGITDQKVLSAMKEVPREEFVLPQYREKAHGDLEVPFSNEDTNNKPYEDALILSSLELTPESKVLEVGTASGLQSALMSRLAREVYSIEIVPEYANQAQKNIERIGYKNIHIKTGDGFFGWPEFAPFDAIYLNCSPTKVPQKLIDQLSEDGRMIVPVGGKEKFQTWFLYKKMNGKLVKIKELAPVTFTPMKGKTTEQN